jgi:hypothetical protein
MKQDFEEVVEYEDDYMLFSSAFTGDELPVPVDVWA